MPSGVSAFKPVAGGRLGFVGRPLPPAPRPQPPRLDTPPQPVAAAQPYKRYNPASVYGGGVSKRDSDERSLKYHTGDDVRV